MKSASTTFHAVSALVVFLHFLQISHAQIFQSLGWGSAGLHGQGDGQNNDIFALVRLRQEMLRTGRMARLQNFHSTQKRKPDKYDIYMAKRTLMDRIRKYLQVSTTA